MMTETFHKKVTIVLLFLIKDLLTKSIIVNQRFGWQGSPSLLSIPEEAGSRRKLGIILTSIKSYTANSTIF